MQQVFIAMTLYVVAVVALLARLNLWEWTNLKTTLLWWLTVGFAAVFQAQKITEERHELRRLVKAAVSLTVLITFVSEFESFPLLIELALPVPLTLVACMLAVAPHQPAAYILVKPLTWILTVAGFAFFGWGLRGMIIKPDEFWTWNNLREFGDPILLSLAFVPFLYGLAVMMAYESMFISLRIMSTTEPKLIGYAKRQALLHFGLDWEAAKRLARNVKLHDVVDRTTVDAEIREIKALKKREKNPPVVPTSEGWSPYEALTFLSAFGVEAKDWHRSFDVWAADALSVKLGGDILPDRVSFYLTGHEHAVTRMALTLDATYGNDNATSDEQFYAMVRVLLEHAFAADQVNAILKRIKAHKKTAFEIDGKKLSIDWDKWGIGKKGGYNRRFVLLHEKHPPDPYAAL